MKYVVDIRPETYAKGAWIASQEPIILDIPSKKDSDIDIALREALLIPTESAVSEEDMSQYVTQAKDIFKQAESGSANTDTFFEILDRMETIDLSSQCNHSCIHCYISDNPHYYTPLDDIKRHIKTLPKGYYRAVSLFGGEPTVYPHVIDVMEFALDHGLVTHLNTNGHKLGNVPFFDRLVTAGLAAVTLSLHTHDLAKFDKITRSEDSGKETWRALRNLYERNIIIMTQTVLTRELMPDLMETLDLIQQVAPGSRMVLSASYPHGYADSLDVTPPHYGMTPYLQPVLEKWGKLITTIDIPMCYLHPYQDIVLNRDEAVKKSDHKSEHIKLPECAECIYDERCIGMLEKYGELYDYRPVPVKKNPSENPREHITSALADVATRLGAEDTLADIATNINEFICTTRFSLTPHCNLKCEHCIQEQDNITPSTLQQFKDDIDRLDPVQTPILNIMGKEPTMHSDLSSMLRYAREKKFFTYMPTNGMLLADDYLQELIDAGLNLVTLTLHSASREVFERVTGVEGSYDAAWKALHTLHSHEQEIDFFVTIVLTTTTLPTVYRTIEKIQQIAPGILVSLVNCIPGCLVSKDGEPTKFDHSHDHLVPALEDIKSALKPVLARWPNKIITDDIPLCCIHPYSSIAMDGTVPGIEYYKPITCTQCSLNDECLGINTAYSHLYSTSLPVNNTIIDRMKSTLRVAPEDTNGREERTRALGELYERLGVINITDRCNHACEHCCSAEVTYGHKNLLQLQFEIDTFDPEQISVISFFGREPTMNTDLLEAMLYAKSLGFLSQISTNGEVLGAENGQAFIDQLVDAGLVTATVSVHTTDRELSDRITKTTSYDNIWNAIQRLYDSGVLVITQTVMTRHILPTLMNTLDEIQARCPGSLMFLSGCLPYGRGDSEELVPSFAEVQQYLYSVLDKWGKYLTVEHIPDCFIQPYHKTVVNQDIFLLEGTDFEFAEKPAECTECLHDDSCPGILQNYMKYYPDTTVNPIK